MNATYASLRRLARTSLTPLAVSARKPPDTQRPDVDPADTLDAWLDSGVDVPPYMCESTGKRRALRRPVLAVPSGHSMQQTDADYLGQSCLQNRVLRQAMERLVAGEPDWDEAVCPITLEAFIQPVQIASPFLNLETQTLHIEDHAYELAAIEDWIAACGKIAATLQGAMPTSPMTRARLCFPIVLVANVAVANMCRAKRGLPALSEAEERVLRRACREASLVLNHSTGQTHKALQRISGILLSGLGLAFTIELFASREQNDGPIDDFVPPARNDSGFWHTCTGLAAQGAPAAWDWTPKAARRACAAPAARCRLSAIDLIDELCADLAFGRPISSPWIPARNADDSTNLRCRFLLSACDAGKRAYLASPHYQMPAPYHPATDLWPYHVGALGALMAAGLGAVGMYMHVRRRPRRPQISPV